MSCVCGYGLWTTYGLRVLLPAGALRADRSALYSYMACPGASPYLREAHPLTASGETSLGTYGGQRLRLCGLASVPHTHKLVSCGCGCGCF